MKKITIEDMRKVAQGRGGKCLSSRYINTSTKILWECSEGHTWTAIPSSIKAGKWCRECAINKRASSQRLSLADAQTFAKNKKGLCLSVSYKNTMEKMRWECAKGHIWDAPFGNLRGGSWCPYCSGRRNLSIEKMHEYATSRGGKCLSKTYKNNSTKIKWQCSKGHKWSSIGSIVTSKTWCMTCAGRAIGTLAEMKEIAISRNGKCLSGKYSGNKGHLHWACEFGHKWKAIPSAIKRGTWCPVCADGRKGDATRYSIFKMKEFAKKRGGECLSDVYVNSKSPLRWRCADGHEWEVAYNADKWCPDCKTRIHELLSKFIFEEYLGVEFRKKRKVFGSNLELDGFNEELAIAFEHQGKQHYEYIPFFHRKPSNFKKQQMRDAEKRRLCNRHKVTLIEIPYTESANKKKLAWSFEHFHLRCFLFPRYFFDKHWPPFVSANSIISSIVFSHKPLHRLHQ